MMIQIIKIIKINFFLKIIPILNVVSPYKMKKNIETSLRIHLKPFVTT